MAVTVAYGTSQGLQRLQGLRELLLAGMGLTLTPKAAPVVFWDLYGQKGHPIRTTVSQIGPVLLDEVFRYLGEHFHDLRHAQRDD